MKSKPFCLALLVAALAGPILPAPATAGVEVSFSVFQESLSPYGEWIEVGDYGNCWRPTGVGEDWAPYTDGYWAYTDAGWTWVSYEDWGDVTYHYGRWTRVSGEGWCWVPDREWAPAWVSWRSNDDYVGWAPLPPEARWRPSVGISVWADTSYDIGPDYYSFCRVRDFGAPVLGPVCLPRVENVTYIQNTVNITNITYNRTNSVIFNGGPNFVNINRVVNRPIPALKLVQQQQLVGGRGFKTRQQGNQLAMFTPTMKLAKDDGPRVKPARVIPADRVNRGWGQIKDPEVKQKLRQKLKQEANGLTPESAPAKPMVAQDIAAVPKKADPTAPSPVAGAKNRGKGLAGGKPERPDRPDQPGDRPNRPDVAQRPDGTPDGDAAKMPVVGGGKERPDKALGKKGPQVALPVPADQVGDHPGRGKAAKADRVDQPGKGDQPAIDGRPARQADAAGRPEKPGKNAPLRPFNANDADQADRPGKRDQANRDAAEAPARIPRPDAPEKPERSAAQQELRKQQQQREAQVADAEQQQQKAARIEARREQQQQQQQQTDVARGQRERAANAEARKQKDGAEQAAQARRAQQQQAAGEQRALEQRRQQAQAQNAQRQQQAVEMQRAAQQQRRAESAQQPPQRQAQQAPQRQVQQVAPPQRAPQQFQRPPQAIQRAPQQAQPSQDNGGRQGKKRLTPEEAAKMQQGRF